MPLVQSVRPVASAICEAVQEHQEPRRGHFSRQGVGGGNTVSQRAVRDCALLLPSLRYRPFFHLPLLEQHSPAKVSLIGVDLSFIDAGGLDLRESTLIRVQLLCANLVGVNLSYSDLRAANLKGASLAGANLTAAGLHQADLSGADLRGAVCRYSDWRQANLRGADLRDAVLSRVDFTGATLTDAIVDQTVFSQCVGLSEATQTMLKQRGAIIA